MSAFDATIRVGEASIQPVQGPDGKNHEVHLILGVLTVAPVGPGQLLPIPIGLVRVPLDYDALSGLIQAGQAALEDLEKPSRLEVVTSPAAAEQAAQQAKRFESGLRG
jgi:hypothetical protein